MLTIEFQKDLGDSTMSRLNLLRLKKVTIFVNLTSQGGHPSWKSWKCPGIPFGSWKWPGSNKNWPLSWKSESFSHLCPGNLSNPVFLIVKPVNSSS